MIRAETTAASPSASRRDRRKDLERWLTECGLLRRPRRVGGREDQDDPGFARRLRRGLEGGGRVWRLFGRYLASRPDLLPAMDCLELAGIPDEHEIDGPGLRPAGRREAGPPGGILAWVGSELGHPPAEVFASFDEEACECRLLWQAHRARLTDGEPVLVRVRPPEIDGEIERDLDLLALLDPVFAEAPGAALPFAAIADDFRHSLRARLDFAAWGADWDSLARDLVDGESAAVPAVRPAWTSERILTTREHPDAAPSRAVDDPAGAPGRDEAVRRLTLVWLQQALMSRTFPVEFEATRLADGRWLLRPESLAHLPSASQPNLWRYLRAVAGHRPDEACESLVRELRPRTREATEAALHLHLRQVVPYRDGGWSERGDGVAEHVMLHWRAIRDCGFAAKPHLRELFRGLFRLARLGRDLAPASDPLRLALDDLRWLATWGQLRSWADPHRLGETLESNLAGLLELPQRLEQVLDQASREDIPIRLRVTESQRERRSKDNTATVISLGLVMAGLAILASRGPALGLDSDVAEGLGAIAFLALGAWLLRVLFRRESP